MNLIDLLDQALLVEMREGGYVRVQHNPKLPLEIYNYTEKAQYERVWNDVTRTCRGLIVDSRTGEIVARPLRKFFNAGEPAAEGLDTAGPVCVTDKMDGSLGILYPHHTSAFSGVQVHAIATRGSFESDQAKHATNLFNRRYAHRFEPLTGATYLFEIVYPENRIVVDYAGMDDLVLLAVVETETGRSLPFGRHGWPGPLVEQFPHTSLTAALAADPRAGAEGLVVHFTDIDERLKIKQDDYVMLHRIVTGFTARRLWERCAVHATRAAHPDMPLERVAHGLRLNPEDAGRIVEAGPDWLDEVRRVAPEEFLDWIDDTIRNLTEQAEEVQGIAEGEALGVRGLPRREAALSIQDHPYRGLIFAALDGKPITAQAWAAVYPDHEVPFRTRSEDAA